MILSEFRVGRQGECCICFEEKLVIDLLVIDPCGHHCVCVTHSSQIVGKPCPICHQQAEKAVSVYDVSK